MNVHDANLSSYEKNQPDRLVVWSWFKNESTADY